MANQKFFVIDFDSTFTKVEALDELAKISLEGHPEKNDRVQKIKEITDLGMDGRLSVKESLQRRIALLEANKDDLQKLIDQLQNEVSESFKRNREFIQTYKDNIYIISNGFRDFIEPVVTPFGVHPAHILANTFLFDEAGNITGFDPDNTLCGNNGKVEQLRLLELEGDVYVLGDGYTDYEIKAAGMANKFYAFTENIRRDAVVDKADHIAPNLDEFLFIQNMPRAFSYPKHRIRVLLLENIHPVAVEILRSEGFSVETVAGALDEDELIEQIKGVSILGIRSKTNVTERVLQAADRLMSIGAFCIGTNQIDLEAAAKRGIAVFNAPFSNTRSVVELTIASIIMLIRQIPDKSVQMHQGIWNKSAGGSHEVRGKKLGIIGYGNIGAQLSVVAEAVGMKVYYYDVVEKLALGNATKCRSLEELLNKADILSLHVDGRTSNKNLIDAEAFRQMKDGVLFLNMSRGHVVDIAALKDAINSKKVGGAAIDVFPKEPKTNDEEFQSELRGLPNVILTPHIGGSTLEAQYNIGEYVPARFTDYINGGSTTGSVNFPNLQLPRLENAHRLIHIHHNTPGILASINQILANHNINITGQYLKTNENIGYVITDIDKQYSQDVVKDLKNIKNTIKFRVLY
ncbi:D-3-phosphoglycerate dehydrogenase [Flammeovirgaceae bacterium 311]|nr:D-3-phosphoglycerate dehydrogenase [Flammeovirgaceae bacterium 311]